MVSSNLASKASSILGRSIAAWLSLFQATRVRERRKSYTKTINIQKRREN
jgi:hypothetical protein